MQTYKRKFCLKKMAAQKSFYCTCERRLFHVRIKAAVVEEM